MLTWHYNLNPDSSNIETKDECELGLDWIKKRESIMFDLLELKAQDLEIVETLRNTKNKPIVYAVKDPYWGINMNERLAQVTNEVRGRNKIGELWEKIRTAVIEKV